MAHAVPVQNAKFCWKTEFPYSKPGFPQLKPFLVLFGLPSPDFIRKQKICKSFGWIFTTACSRLDSIVPSDPQPEIPH